MKIKYVVGKDGTLATVKIEEYIELYNKGLTLDDIEPLKNQTYKVFKMAKSAGVRIIDRTWTYENPAAFEKIKHFVNDNPFFYMIPVKTIKETITGFIVRGVTKSDYNTVSREFKNFEKQVPLMYGFDKAFRKLDSYNKSYPIVICEGCKDCLMLKRFYPYVLANNTSSMGLNATILRNISDKFILAYDNDKAGQEGIERDKKILVETGAYVQVLKLDEGFKDCADYMKDYDKLKSLSKQLKVKLKRLNELSL